MSFSVHVTPDLVSLEPGATTPVSIVVVNKGTETDRFELEIEGIDAEWKAVPVPIFPVDAGETLSEKIFFKPPRASESLAGNYPFVVKLRSLVSGEQRSAQGVAQVKPFHHLSVEIDPKKGVISPTRKQNRFTLTLVNLGNTEHTLQLLANDPEDACAYDFEQEQVALGPGQQKDIDFVANPTKSPILSSGRLIGFSVTARSIDSPSIASSAAAQLEQRPLLTPASIAALFFIALLVGAWYLMMPRPPSISLFLDQRQIVQGQTVTVSWDAEHAKRVTINAGDQTVYEGSETKGKQTVTLNSVGNITIRGEATNGDQKKVETREITVTQPPTVPLPEITSLSANPKKVRLGEPFLMEYSLSDSVTRAVLEPDEKTIDKALDRLYVTPVQTGDIEYTLVAENAAGETTKRSFTVTVYDQSDAQILDFHASSKSIKPEDGKVTLTWQVTGAERLEIKAGDAEPITLPMSGSQDFPMTTKTTFVLSAIDAKNRRSVRSVTVHVEIPALPPTDGSTGKTVPEATGSSATGATSATAGGSTGTTGPGATAGGLR